MKFLPWGFQLIFCSCNFFMAKCNVSWFFNYELNNVLDFSDLSSSIFYSNAISLSFVKISKLSSTWIGSMFLGFVNKPRLKNQIVFLVLVIVIIQFQWILHMQIMESFINIYKFITHSLQDNAWCKNIYVDENMQV
jgi:hypothetical protein